MFQTKQGAGNPYGSDTIDIRELLKKFTKYWYLFVICGFLATSVAYLMARSAIKYYRVKASIILNDQSTEVTSFESILKSYKVAVPTKSIPNEIGMLQSYRLIRQAVSKMDVGVSYFSRDKFKTRYEYKDVPFTIEVDSSHNQLVYLDIEVKRLNETQYRVRASGEEIYLHNIENDEILRELEVVEIDQVLNVGEPYVDNMLSFQVYFKPDWQTYNKDQYFFQINTLDGLADRFMGGLSVSLVSDDANIISLTHESPLVELSKQFIDALLVEYRENEIASKRELGERTLEVLDRQLGKVSDERETISQGKRGAQSTVFDPTLTANINTQQIQKLQYDRTQEVTKLEYYRNILSRMENNPNAMELPAPSSLNVNDQVLTNLILKLSQLNEERVGLEQTVNVENSPIYQVHMLKIKNTQSAIIENVKSSIRASEIQLNEINAQIGRARGELNLLPSIAANIKEEDSKAAINDEMFQNLMNQRNIIELALETISVDMEVIDSPKQDGYKAVSPKKSMFYMVALMFGIGIPAVFILLRDFFDKRIKGYDDIEASTNIPVLGFIARHDRNSSYIVPKDSRTALAESFRSVRIKLHYLNDDGPQRVIGVTSSSSGEGKTFCATNLAAVFAQSGKRTLLIDIDLRRPRVTRYFENGDGRGLSTYLIGEVNDHREIIHKTHIENLDVVHSGPVCTNPLDLIATDKMIGLLDKLREEYDHIVLDTPPVGLVADYLVIMKLTDFNVYVVRDTTTNVENLRMINELYDSEKITNVSILINDVKSLSNYGYIDKYYGYGDE